MTVQGKEPRQLGLTGFLSNNTFLSHGLAAGETTVKSTSFKQFSLWLSPFWLPFFFSFLFLQGGLLGNTMKPGRASRDKSCDVVSASGTRTAHDSTTHDPSALSHHPWATSAISTVPLSSPRLTALNLQSPILHLESKPQLKVTPAKGARLGRLGQAQTPD